MKRTLYLKLLSSYLIFWLIALILLGIFTPSITDNYLTKKEAQKLYREASLIAAELKNNSFASTESLEDIQKDLETAGEYLSCEIWVVDTTGNLRMNSSDSNLYMDTEKEANLILGFHIADFGNSYYKSGTFYDCFSSEQLTVFSSITGTYKVRGYVLMHKPMTQVLEASDDISNLAFYAAVIVFACSFIVLFTFAFVVYRPIQKITNAAEDYARGDFSKKIHMGKLSDIGF